MSAGRLVTVVVIDFEDPADAPAFADAVKLIVKTTRKLSLKGAVRVEAYGDLAGTEDIEEEDDPC